jgi:hypothetical protein
MMQKFSETLLDMSIAIDNELKHYSDLKEASKEKNRLKRKKKTKLNV